MYFVPLLFVQIDSVQQNLHSWQNALSLLKVIYINSMGPHFWLLDEDVYQIKGDFQMSKNVDQF